MAHPLGDAFRSIAQSVSQMQDAMWAMNKKMERTNDTVCSMAQRLKLHGNTVQKLDRRMNMLELRSSPASFAFPAPGAQQHPMYPQAPGTPSAVTSSQAPTMLHQSMSCAASAFDAMGVSPVSSCAAMAGTTYPGAAPCRQVMPPPRATASCTVCAPASPAIDVAPCANPCCVRRCPVFGRKLLKAVQKGKAKQVRVLLNAGADANFSAEGKWTPLHCAAARANAPIVSLLLNRGANVNAKTAYSFTPLHIAADNDYSARCVLLLIAGGGDLGSRNRCGRTPLHYASECGNEAAVRALVAAGSSKNAEDDKGKTPYDIAKTLAVRRLLRPVTRGRKACSWTHDVTRFEFNS